MDVDCVVVGAGVIGLAVARTLARAGLRVVILEREGRIGEGISARGSAVIHAGLYYPDGSLKATTCVAGRERLYRYCAEHAIPHRRCGKYLVATAEAQVARLEAIRDQACRNGVDDLEWLDAPQMRRREPGLTAHAALFSPSTGILDVPAYLAALSSEAQARGARIAHASAVSRIRPIDGGFEITAGNDSVLRSRLCVNAAGLDAMRVAASVAGFAPALIPALHYAKGNYFALAGPAPFSRLIYPLPERAGLGIHMTLDLAGRARFGPDVEWVDGLDYRVEPARATRFYAAIRRYWPGLRDGQLSAAHAGIRPKLVGPDEAEADFRLCGPETHGMPGLVHLFGIESPGVTASLALAERVAAALQQ